MHPTLRISVVLFLKTKGETMPNQNDADPPVRSQDPFRKQNDPLSRETAAGDDQRKPNVVVESDTYSDTGPDAVGVSESEAQADTAQSGHAQAERQARQAGSGTTGHEVEPEANADMDLLGFDKKKKK